MTTDKKEKMSTVIPTLVGMGFKVEGKTINVQGPEAYNVDDITYWKKLAGTDNIQLTEREKAENVAAEMSNKKLLEYLEDAKMGIVKARYYNSMAKEALVRGLINEMPVEREIGIGVKIKKDSCCDGGMFEFGNGATICVTEPKQFTQIKELVGDTICAEKSTKFPPILNVIQGDGEAVVVDHRGLKERDRMTSKDGGKKIYFSRDLMPNWMWDFLDLEAKNDPATVEIRKAIWEQMLKAITKKKHRLISKSGSLFISSLALHHGEKKKKSKKNKISESS